MKKYITERIEYHQDYIDRLSILKDKVDDSLKLEKLFELLRSGNSVLCETIVRGQCPDLYHDIMYLITMDDKYLENQNSIFAEPYILY